jgi:hypothetical protein
MESAMAHGTLHRRDCDNLALACSFPLPVPFRTYVVDVYLHEVRLRQTALSLLK